MFSLLLHSLLAITGVWNAWGFNAGNWNELAALLSRNGFDTVFYCAAYGPLTDTEGLSECIEACAEYGIDVHALVVMWKTSCSADSLRTVLAGENRMQLSIDGNADAETWLCPSRSENVQLMASICLKLAAEFPVRGIHLDYIRYSSDRVCFCDECRTRFQRETGNHRLVWPDDCYRGGRLYDEFNRWRSENITSAVEAIRDSLDRLNRVVELSAAVLPRERERDYFAQHWERWLAAGTVDFVVPMNYTLSDSELVYWGKAQIETAGATPIPCGLITNSGEYLHTPSEIRRQIETALDLGFRGTVLFHLSSHLVSILQSESLYR